MGKRAPKEPKAAKAPKAKRARRKGALLGRVTDVVAVLFGVSLVADRRVGG